MYFIRVLRKTGSGLMYLLACLFSQNEKGKRPVTIIEIQTWILCAFLAKNDQALSYFWPHCQFAAARIAHYERMLYVMPNLYTLYLSGYVFGHTCISKLCLWVSPEQKTTRPVFSHVVLHLMPSLKIKDNKKWLSIVHPLSNGSSWK